MLSYSSAHQRISIQDIFCRRFGPVTAKQSDVTEETIEALGNPQLAAINTLHSIFRGRLGKAYGDLLKESPKTYDRKPLQAEYDRLGATDTITLHFHGNRSLKNFTLPNVRIDDGHDDNGNRLPMNLAQTLLLLGAAAEKVIERHDEDEESADTESAREYRRLLDAMRNVHRHLFPLLQEKGFSEEDVANL